MYKTLHKKQGSVTVQLRFARSSVTFCAKRDNYPKDNWKFVNYLDTGSLTENKITELQYINTKTDKMPSRARRKVIKKSILYSTVRPNQLHYGIIKEPVDNLLVSTGFTVIDVDTNKAIPEFIYYLLIQNNTTEQLQAIAEQSVSTYPSIKPSDIENLEFKLPNLIIQSKIVSILDTIDSKICQNEKINNNLEQQAQVIFLKMFPDIFSASASSSFQKLIEFSNGRKRPETIGDIPVYGGNGVLAYTNQSNAENCVIIGRVGAYCGNTFLCPEKCWTSDNAIQAKSKNEASPLFIYYLLRNASLPSRHIGTGQPLMTQAILNAIPVNEPSTQEIKSFINICTPLHETIFANEKQNISLAILRDTLLPKLMSGELDVSDLDI